jgi:hypothetical protein
MKDKEAVFEAIFYDLGIDLNDDNPEALVESFVRLSDSVTTEEVSKQLAYKRARDRESLPYMESNEEVVTTGMSQNFMSILKKVSRDRKKLPNDKDVNFNKFIGRSGRPAEKPEPEIVVINDDIGDFVEYEADDPSIHLEDELAGPEEFIDDKPTYVSIDTDAGLHRIKRQIKKFIVGNLRERFKQLAVIDERHVHEMAAYIVAKVEELEKEYTTSE